MMDTMTMMTAREAFHGTSSSSPPRLIEATVLSSLAGTGFGVGGTDSFLLAVEAIVPIVDVREALDIVGGEL